LKGIPFRAKPGKQLQGGGEQRGGENTGPAGKVRSKNHGHRRGSDGREVIEVSGKKKNVLSWELFNTEIPKGDGGAVIEVRPLVPRPPFKETNSKTKGKSEGNWVGLKK